MAWAPPEVVFPLGNTPGSALAWHAHFNNASPFATVGAIHQLKKSFNLVTGFPYPVLLRRSLGLQGEGGDLCVALGGSDWLW